MGQFFTDDIDSLLKSGHGDSARLANIREEFVRTKLVSIDDRKYVEGLLARYSQTVEVKQEKIKESRIVPPPPPPRNPPTLLEVKQKPKKAESIPKLQGGKTKLRNVVISVCATAFAVLVVSFVAMSQDLETGIVAPSVIKVLELDSSSYVRGDIISISGKTKEATSIATLSITNPAGKQIWNEVVTVKPSGTFATLVIAGGEGWDQLGTHTVSVSYSGNSDTAKFSFDPS